MKPCPACHADAAKPRVGALGESKGVWCTQCGFATTTLGGWENRPTPTYDEACHLYYPPGTVQTITSPKPYANPNASRGPGGGMPAYVETLISETLDAVAWNVFRIKRDEVMPLGASDDESFREHLRGLYEATKP